MTTRTIIAAITCTLGIAFAIDAGLTFEAPGDTIRLLGIPIGTTESQFIPPLVGALSVAGGFALTIRIESSRARGTTIGVEMPAGRLNIRKGASE